MTKYRQLTSNEIIPEGWLLRQLKIQADGLSGNLDKVWADISDSKWIGGNHDGWERVPYWLDGFIPLAYLLKDNDMITRAKKYIDAIISSQQEDGWICPCRPEERSSYDMWALFLICKVLVQYYECSKDVRIQQVVYKALENLNSHIKNHKLFEWGKSRWFECLIPIKWLYERCGKAWLLELVEELHKQGLDYTELFGKNWSDQLPERKWTHETHVVNLSMALKSDALYKQFSDGDMNSFAESMLDKLFTYHGTAVGHFTGDECLSGNSPIQGTELCGVVEAMYSYETLFTLTGDPKWLDRLETLAFNALPATISPDMWTHQYDQMVNQITCRVFPEDKNIFKTNSVYSNIYGLEPNFGCCTANFNQGWPKFALNTFMTSKTELLSAVLVPSTVNVSFGHAKVSCTLTTLYPFRDKLVYKIVPSQKVHFDFSIRIPSFVDKAYVNDKEVPVGQIHTISKTWKIPEIIEVVFKTNAKFVERPEDMVCLQKGALIYSVAIDEDWKLIDENNQTPYADREIYPNSKWNYAYQKRLSTQVNYNDDFDYPFSHTNPPINLICEMYEIDWGFEAGYEDICEKVPKIRTQPTRLRQVKLHPYGCTALRITETIKV